MDQPTLKELTDFSRKLIDCQRPEPRRLLCQIEDPFYYPRFGYINMVSGQFGDDQLVLHCRPYNRRFQDNGKHEVFYLDSEEVFDLLDRFAPDAAIFSLPVLGPIQFSHPFAWKPFEAYSFKSFDMVTA